MSAPRIELSLPWCMWSGMMELLSLSIAASNQILIFLDRWETAGPQTDTLYLNSHGTTRLTHHSLLIIFTLWRILVLVSAIGINDWACLFIFISKRRVGAAGMFFLILSEYQYYIQSVILLAQPSNEIVLQMILSKGKDFYWMKIK